MSADQLTFDHEREIERVAGGVRELHPKREFGGVCSEAYRLCCERLRTLSPTTFTALMYDLEDEVEDAIRSRQGRTLRVRAGLTGSRNGRERMSKEIR